MIPSEEKIGLPSASMPAALADTYIWDNNPWSGEINAALAGNIQWDFFRNGGTLLVRMLFNEKETDFPATCESARYLRGTQSHYYVFNGLKACYGY